MASVPTAGNSSNQLEYDDKSTPEEIKSQKEPNVNTNIVRYVQSANRPYSSINNFNRFIDCLHAYYHYPFKTNKTS
jgi:hypothetical protein